MLWFKHETSKTKNGWQLVTEGFFETLKYRIIDKYHKGNFILSFYLITILYEG